MKIVQKLKNGSDGYILFCGFKIFHYKRKIKNKVYYATTIFNEVKKLWSPEVPEIKVDKIWGNCIWQLWLQGEDNCPLIVRRCLESVKKFANGRQVIVLSEENMDKYVQIPDFIKDKYERGIISKTHLSDYIRVMLLAQYGGIWIDATCLLTKDIPEDIANSDFFVFTNKSWMNMSPPAPDITFFEFLQHFYHECYHIGSSWFMSAKPNNAIILSILQMLNSYWRNNNQLMDYFLFHYIMTVAVLSSDKNRKCFDKMPKYSQLPPHILQYNLFNDFDQSVFNKLTEYSFVHKLTYKNLEKGSNTYLTHILHNYTLKREETDD